MGEKIEKIKTKGRTLVRKHGRSVTLWYIGIILALIIGAYLSPILSGYVPFLDTFPPYVYSTYPSDNTLLPSLEEIRIDAREIGGAGLDLKKSILNLHGKINGNISCSLNIESGDLIFKPDKNLTADEYTAEIFIYDRAGNVVQKTFTFQISEPNVSVKMEPYPVYKDGQYYARFYIINEGKSPLTSISAEYQFLCFMNETKTAIPDSRYLKENEKTNFDIPFSGTLKYNCTFPEVTLNFYEDAEKNLYSECVNTTVMGCGCCNVNVSVTAKEVKEIKSFDFCYPFSDTELHATFGSKNCLTKDQIKGMNLTKVPDRQIKMIFFGLQEPCLRGEIDMSWCKERGII